MDGVKGKHPANYEEWLASSEEAKREIKRTWNVYQREGFGFALCAAGRLAIQSTVKGEPPADSPLAAVRVWLVSQARK